MYVSLYHLSAFVTTFGRLLRYIIRLASIPDEMMRLTTAKFRLTKENNDDRVWLVSFFVFLFKIQEIEVRDLQESTITAIGHSTTSWSSRLKPTNSSRLNWTDYVDSETAARKEGSLTCMSDRWASAELLSSATAAVNDDMLRCIRGFLFGVPGAVQSRSNWHGI